MTSFTSKKNIEDIIKDGVIITTGTTGTFFGLEAAGVTLPSLGGGREGGREEGGGGGRGGPSERLCSPQKMDQRVIQQKRFYSPMGL